MAIMLAASLFLAGARAHAQTPAAPRIEFQDFRLENGLRVLLTRDPSAPVAAETMIFNVGGRCETPGRSGFAHLFEHLMFEGSAHAPKGAFDRVLEAYGGENNASTHEDFTFYYEVVPSNALPIALWLDADRVSALAVSEEAMKNQIAVVEEEKRMRVDNEPYGAALYVDLASATFSNWQNAHPVIGSFADLDAATLKDVKAFFDAYYAPKNGVLAVSGDIDLAATRRAVEKYFAWIPNRGETSQVDVSEPAPAGAKGASVSDPHANLPALGVTWKGMPARGSADFYPLVLLGQALFSGKSSVLYQELVKKEQAAVSVDGGLGFPVSDPDEYKAPGALGVFVVYKAGRSAAEVRDLIERAAREAGASGLSAKDLARVKTKFRSDWILGSETALGRAQKLAVAAILDGDPEAANSLDRYMAVTAQDVERVAKQYLTPAAMTVLEVAPGGKK